MFFFGFFPLQKCKVEQSLSNHKMDSQQINSSLNAAAAEDSPKHILNALNNHCLQECFRRLSTHTDLLNVANVCHRFRAYARACFPPTNITLPFHQTHFHLRAADQRNSRARLKSSIALKDLGIFSYHFGDLIESVELNGPWDDGEDVSIFDRYFVKITQYCAKTLKKLSFYNYHSFVQIGATFKMLEILKIHYNSIVDIQSLPSLKVLDIRYFGERSNRLTNFSLENVLKQHYPELIVMILDDVARLNDRIIAEFLQLNPQLRTIQVSYCNSVITSILDNIGTRLPNLEHLTFVLEGENLSSVIETVQMNWQQIGQIQNLKSLRTNIDQIVSTKSLINLLIENILPIRKLYVQNAYKYIENDLAKLTKLKKFSATQFNSDEIPTKIGALCISRHQWIVELCNID